jgi:hypothetical protein
MKNNNQNQWKNKMIRFLTALHDGKAFDEADYCRRLAKIKQTQNQQENKVIHYDG